MYYFLSCTYTIYCIMHYWKGRRMERKYFRFIVLQVHSPLLPSFLSALSFCLSSPKCSSGAVLYAGDDAILVAPGGSTDENPLCSPTTTTMLPQFQGQGLPASKPESFLSHSIFSIQSLSDILSLLHL